MTLNILWWVAFFVFGLALQQALPGTDVLVAGLFLALQERRPFQLAVVLLALILVQEGVGTLDFGTVRSLVPSGHNALFHRALDVRDGKLAVRAASQRLYRLGALRRHLADDAASVYSSRHDAAARRKHSPSAADAVCLAMQHDGAPVGGPQ